MTDIQQSSIAKEYPSFLNNPQAVSFFVDSLRPLVDRRVKPDELQSMVNNEIKGMHKESHAPVDILHLVGILSRGLEFVRRFWALY